MWILIQLLNGVEYQAQCYWAYRWARAPADTTDKDTRDISSCERKIKTIPQWERGQFAIENIISFYNFVQYKSQRLNMQ